MTKVGRGINHVTKDIIQASGVATQSTGAAISKLGKKIGVCEEKCNNLEQSSETLGKDIYYASRNAGKKAEKLVDSTIDETKKLVQSVKNRHK